MRVLVLSDIHANLEAFRAVLRDAAASWEAIWNLGDLVGYGPDPSDCIDIMAGLPAISLMGNHDLVASGLEGGGLYYFNPHARACMLWTLKVLKADERAYLARLPRKLVREGFTLAHGSPRDPIWEYVFTAEEAVQGLRAVETPHCLSGHTHCRLSVKLDYEAQAAQAGPTVAGAEFSLRGASWYLNPGSVGFPRAPSLPRDPKLSPYAPPGVADYALLDTTRQVWAFRRVRYNPQSTIKKMARAGLLDEPRDEPSF